MSIMWSSVLKIIEFTKNDNSLAFVQAPTPIQSWEDMAAVHMLITEQL